MSDQLGVAARDPVGHKIGPNVAKRTGVGLNWYPVDIYKQTLVGTLHHFNFYDGIGDEADWNNFIIPTMPFGYILKDVLPIADSGDVHDCISKDDCVEAEITPDEHFYENPYFRKSTDKSALEGKLIGTYGPWVWEEAHGDRPEIRSELYWWPERGSTVGNRTLYTYFLMVLQDDSNRFDRAENYSGSIKHPWSENPRTAEFKIAFELKDVNRNPVLPHFSIDELYARNVVTSDYDSANKDADDGKQHRIQYDGKIVLKVDELQARDKNMGVRFLEVTRNAANNRLQGYITITSKIGKGDRGDEGYHVIRVAEGRTEDVPIGPEPGPVLKPAILAKALPQTLRYTVIDGQPRLVGDVRIQTLDNSGAPPISKLNFTAAGKRSFTVELQAVPQEMRSKGVIGVVKDIQVFGGGKLELQSPQSGNVKLVSPQMTLAPYFSEQKPLLFKDNREAWPNFVKAAGGAAIGGTPPAQLKIFQQLQIDIAPLYAVLRNGKVSREDDSPFTEELNNILRKGNMERTKQVFGSDQPIREVNWSFNAKNLTSGQSVAVKVGEIASSTEIKVDFPPSKPQKASIKVTFPTQPANAVFELIATAEMIDVYGNKGHIRKTISSHALTSDDKNKLVESVLPAIVSIAGIPSNKNLLSASKIDGLPEDDRTVRDPFSRCARMLRLFAMRITEDANIDVDELGRLRRVAELCKSR